MCNMKKNEQNEEIQMSFDHGKAAKLDDKDWKILELLAHNARMPISTIARKLQLNRDVVKYRLEKLISEKVINSFLTLVNAPKLGFTIWGYMHIKFKDLNKKRENEFLSYIKNSPYVFFAYSNLGAWDFGVEYSARDLNHFYELQKELNEKFSSIIKDYETGSFMKIHKINFVPSQTTNVLNGSRGASPTR